MKTILHKATTRGHAHHGWLESWHTFSFAGYHDEQRVHFGALRVLNDDSVAPGMGFGRHPHDNMEIISIPLEGDLEHSDNMGNTAVIRQGDVQVMSAGTGIAHSEKNANSDKPVKFLQIWVFPKERNVKPRYDQKSFPLEARRNRLQNVVAPVGADADGVQIHQDAWFHLGQLDAGTSLEYALKDPANGLYVFVLKGDLYVNEVLLNQRDGLGVSAVDAVSLKAEADAEVLLMEVPLA
ncbi:pirin family protein [Flaviaesturariibacter amylovorans]|uniref:Pirin family protein n=1 Tax=Flaviaesturariibacter amylovorans TaxID=1084520 RepID=A0ABP8GVI1_9BACT